MNTTVDAFFDGAPKWQDELLRLRMIILDCGLDEELKWSVPCYTFEGTNIVAINGLKESCVLSFFKGVLLEDAEGILLQIGVNTQAARWVKFYSDREIVKLEAVLKAYIYEAIEVERAGVKVPVKKKAAPVVEEFQQLMARKPAVKKAFAALTPGRQRGYLLYFADAKQSKTRVARIDKCVPLILKGKGLQDR